MIHETSLQIVQRLVVLSWGAGLVLLGCLASPQELQAERFAFLVGVGDYDVGGDKYDLQNTVPEIKRLQEILEKQRDGNRSYYKQVISITDDIDDNDNIDSPPPTRENIFRKLKELREVLLRDNPAGYLKHSLLIVLNGHGLELPAENDEFTFCPRNALSAKRETRISLPDFMNELCFDEENGQKRAIPAEVLFVVNACRNEPLPGMDLADSGAKNKPVTLKVPKYAILYACKSAQQSLINPKVSDGPRSFFMTELINGWMGVADGKANRAPDGKVDLMELENYLAVTVPQQVKLTYERGEQNPVLATDVQKDDWIINPSVGLAVPDKTIVGQLPASFTYQNKWDGYTFVDIRFPRRLDNYWFRKAKFVRCDFRGTKMTDLTNVGGASFEGCQLDNLDLSGANLTETLQYAGANTGAETIYWGANRKPEFDLNTGAPRK